MTVAHGDLPLPDFSSVVSVLLYFGVGLALVVIVGRGMTSLGTSFADRAWLSMTWVGLGLLAVVVSQIT